MSNRLYVGNISYSTTKESLQAAFIPVGEVREIAIPTDRETGLGRGFAFVTMGSDDEAKLVERFLGRPPSDAAYKAFLTGDAPAATRKKGTK